MGKTGRLCSPAFEEVADRLVRSCGERHPVATKARDLDISAETLPTRGQSGRDKRSRAREAYQRGERRMAPFAQRSDGHQG
jgi:hypothetical protein